MELIPAIDIRGGRCVRLIQGDYARETVYDPDPVAVACGWEERGATRLHVVDLDGAREGRPANRATVLRIAAAVSIPVQASGGVRSFEDALSLREAGVARVIVGTAAVENRGLVQRLAGEFGDGLIVGIDARSGVVMTRGWLQDGGVMATTLARELAACGVRRFIYTDIARDGMLQGPNLAEFRAFASAAGRPVVASGGIATVAHLRAAEAAGAEAAIVGKALYTGDLQLEDALAALDADPATGRG